MIISKIICPTDFSETANNALEYAVKIAKITGAELLLRNVQSISVFEIFPPKIWAEREIKIISDKLEKMCIEVNKMFEISCKYDIELTHPTLENAITKNVSSTDIIIMGTNGVDSWFQLFGGTNTFHVTQKAICPVMVIPENVSYKNIEKIVFAWDGTRESMLSLMRMEYLVKVFNPKIAVLHITKKYHESFEKKFTDMEKEWLLKFPEITFETVSDNNISSTIKEYMHVTESDLLLMISHEHGIIYNVFQQSVTRELTEDAELPLLIQHI